MRVFDGREPLLVQRRRGRLDGPAGQAEQGRAAPQPEGRAQLGHRILASPLGRQPQPLGDPIGEDLGVQLARDGPEPVAGLDGLDDRLPGPRVGQSTTQRRHVVLHLTPGGAGRADLPDRVDEVTQRHQTPRVGQQYAEQGALGAAAQVDRSVGEHLQRPQDAVLHGALPMRPTCPRP